MNEENNPRKTFKSFGRQPPTISSMHVASTHRYRHKSIGNVNSFSELFFFHFELRHSSTIPIHVGAGNFQVPNHILLPVLYSSAADTRNMNEK